MKTVKVRALKQHVYAQIPRKDGEIYEAPDDSLAAIIAFGWVEVVGTKTETADDPKNQTYKRRDMRAQGS